METVSSQAYEVRCEDCQVSFALGTRDCVHCGRRLRRGRPSAVLSQSPAEIDFGVESEPEEAERVRRSALGSIFTTVTVGLAILASLYRSCP